MSSRLPNLQNTPAKVRDPLAAAAYAKQPPYIHAYHQYDPYPAQHTPYYNPGVHHLSTSGEGNVSPRVRSTPARYPSPDLGSPSEPRTQSTPARHPSPDREMTKYAGRRSGPKSARKQLVHTRHLPNVLGPVDESVPTGHRLTPALPYVDPNAQVFASAGGLPSRAPRRKLYSRYKTVPPPGIKDHHFVRNEEVAGAPDRTMIDVTDGVDEHQQAGCRCVIQ